MLSERLKKLLIWTPNLKLIEDILMLKLLQQAQINEYIKAYLCLRLCMKKQRGHS